MKKTILLASLALFISFASKAQFEVGQRVINGGISLSNSNYTSANNQAQSNFYFGSSISIGKFVRANHLVGFAINYSNNSQNQQSPPNTYKNSLNQIGLNYFSTYYKPFAKNLYGFITWSIFGDYNFESDNTTSSGIQSTEKIDGISAGISATPGISYKLNKRVLVNATLSNILSASFTSNKRTYSNSAQVDKYNSFGFSSSLNNINLGNIGIGFSILLNKK